MRSVIDRSCFPWATVRDRPSAAAHCISGAALLSTAPYSDRLFRDPHWRFEESDRRLGNVTARTRRAIQSPVSLWPFSSGYIMPSSENAHQPLNGSAIAPLPVIQNWPRWTSHGRSPDVKYGHFSLAHIGTTVLDIQVSWWRRRLVHIYDNRSGKLMVPSLFTVFGPQRTADWARLRMHIGEITAASRRCRVRNAVSSAPKCC